MTFRSLTIIHAVTGKQVGAFEIGFKKKLSKNCCPVVIPKSWETPESINGPKGFQCQCAVWLILPHPQLSTSVPAQGCWCCTADAKHSSPA